MSKEPHAPDTAGKNSVLPVDGPVTQTVSLKKPFLPWSRSPERCPKQSLGHVVACFGGEPERFWGDILSLFMLWLPLLILLSHGVDMIG